MEGADEFTSPLRALARDTVLSLIWTLVTDYIFSDNNRYAKSVSKQNSNKILTQNKEREYHIYSGHFMVAQPLFLFT